MLSEYRQRFGDFHTELHREDYLFRSGHKHSRGRASAANTATCSSPPPSPNCAQNSKRLPNIERLKRASVKRLIAFAVEGALSARAQEVSDEIEDYEADALVDWHRRVPSRVRLAARR